MSYLLRKRVRPNPALFQQESDSEDEFEQVLDNWIPEEQTDDETEVSDHNTDSEEELSEKEDQEQQQDDDLEEDQGQQQQEAQEEDENEELPSRTFYMGKDGTTKWNVQPTDFGSRRMNMANVTASSTNKKPAGLETELDYFRLFFDSVVINKIVEYTNSFILSFTTEETMKGNYRQTDDIEIKGLIGLLILIGTMKSGTIKQLWQKDMGIGCDLCL